MFRVRKGTLDFVFDFEHVESESGKRTTRCFVTSGPYGFTSNDTDGVKFVAFASPMRKTPFTKAEGRKITLKKVLHSMGWDRADRTRVWAAYHEKRGGAYGVQKPEALRRANLIAEQEVAHNQAYAVMASEPKKKQTVTA